MRNIPLSRLKLNSADRIFFLSLFSAHDLMYLFNFVIQRLRKEKKRERKNKEFYVHRRKKSEKKKGNRREKFHAQRESRIHGTKEKICEISRD